jgi:enterochelin esterase-like enzyme
MGLTSKKVLLLAVVLALLLFGLTVWYWPRLARRGPLAVLGRVGTLLALQVSLLCALALLANTSFGFYGSWADLFGRETAQGTVVDAQNLSAADGKLQVLSTLPVRRPGRGGRYADGRMQKVAIGGGRSGISTTGYVYLPPEYFSQPKRVFPAAVVLTGYPGVAEQLFRKLKYPTTAAEQVRAGREQPMVLVMLRPTVVPPRDTECVDVPHGPQTATFFAHDLRSAVDSRYRVGRSAQSWGVIGDSTGGYCALKLALQDPGSFTAAVGLSADYSCPQDRTTGDLFGGSAAVRRENDLMWRLRHLRQPPVSLLVTSSRHGEHNYRATKRFLSAVHAPARAASIILPTGGHNFSTWGREIPAAMRWLSQQLVPDPPPDSQFTGSKGTPPSPGREPASPGGGEPLSVGREAPVSGGR